MIPQHLSPNLDLLTQEYVLVQAWKKTASYIRYHNWYSDTLALDLATVNLPRFLGELAASLKKPETWQSDALRIVPAPKSQSWRVSGNRWIPKSIKAAARQLRPLAHVSLRDQVASTALMLCMADRVETLQGDPRHSTSTPAARRRVISYGNRLFCDRVGNTLRHRWGSGKLYRAYYQDYRSFLARTEIVGEAALKGGAKRVVVVYSDLRQFFDRVRPHLLTTSINARQHPSDDPRFYKLAKRVLNWNWDARDTAEVSDYRVHSELADFDSIALPQGLVAAGFFSNVVLLDFDERLREAMDESWQPGVRIEDACRYVDDLRLVLSVETDVSHRELENLVKTWLQNLLDENARGLRLSDTKTRAAAFRGDEGTLVRQSRKMARIQTAVSGGFDAIGGKDILEAVQGLIRSQRRFSEALKAEDAWALSPVPDVRDATVARFAAGRFRTTFRSLRMLLPDDTPATGGDDESSRAGTVERLRVSRSKATLDDDARSFALGLIEQWVEDPSNVRLLRIGLDIWPAADVLGNVLALLRPHVVGQRGRRAPRRVAWYCLSEIFRAGATETGFTESSEALPHEVDVIAYRRVLRDEAAQLAKLSSRRLPWYLREQILLFLAVNEPAFEGADALARSPETRQYRRLLSYLRGRAPKLTESEVATLAIVSRRAFVERDRAQSLALDCVTPASLNRIAEQDPSFAIELCQAKPRLIVDLSDRIRADLLLGVGSSNDEWRSIAQVVLEFRANGPLRNELSLARFASSFLAELELRDVNGPITPTEVLVKITGTGEVPENVELKLAPSGVSPDGSMYRTPQWCPTSERWRFQLGFLLRFILTARADFTRPVRSLSWREGTRIYRVPESHWYHRLHGLFNAHAGFGDDWLPISDWTEGLLSSLLSWPGCRPREIDAIVRRGRRATKAAIDEHVRQFLEHQGSCVLMLPVRAPWPIKPSGIRPLRACVVQTVIPGPGDFNVADLTLSSPQIRRIHRNHLSAALAAIERMLALRETHKGRDGRLDWLILPELAVHPYDVQSHLIPFARTHKTIILAGLIYQEITVGLPLVNSAIWIIPQWSKSNGLQMLIRRQGKHNLAAPERRFNDPAVRVRGFRPCQWLVGYEWSRSKTTRPLWLTASVCYDATDLRLAADLHSRSDVYAIPALNQDVTTFDHMALALHYHMFQMVIVANNGVYGGSNAYSPYREAYRKQVFHLHGQPQASIAFLEIDDIAAFLRRRQDAEAQGLDVAASGKKEGGDGGCAWKFPPARIALG